MPRKPTDYSRTVIYKIVCNDLSITDVYVGHTTDFIKRKCKHKSETIKNRIKLYETIRQNGGWENYSMIEIEKYPCIDSNEARSRERYWYEVLKANLNTQYPQQTKQEYTENNKDKIREYKKEYYEKNKDKVKEHNKEYYENNKDKVKEIQKEYLQNNKDILKEKRRLKYLEKISTN